MVRMLKKLIAVLLVITLAGANLSMLGMYGISYALSNEIETENEVVDENATPEAVLEAELTKYIPYATGEKYGVMLQTKVSSGILNSKLPVEKMEVNITVPQINNIKPTKVNVIALNTKATNGETDGTNFTVDNFEYNAETGIVNIVVENFNTEIEIASNVKDEYLVTYIFDGQDIYNYVNTNGVDTKTTTSSNIKLYNDVETILNVEGIETSIKKTEKIGTIADFDISAVQTEIAKGQIYSNFDSTVKKETTYYTRYTSTVNSVDLTDNIEFTQSIDKFIRKDNDKESLTTVSGENYTYNKIVKVSEKVFNKILGANGTITLYDASIDEENSSEETAIGVINKNTEIKDGYYTLDISAKDNNQLYIVASEPQTEGQLIIDIEKAIKTEVGYASILMKYFGKIELNMEGKASTSTVNAMAQILLKDTKSVAEISVSKKDLTTVVKNENVEIRATLDTSSLENALYILPTLKIKLPSYISKVDLKQTDIVMANGLRIEGTPEVTEENGVPVINIELDGIQQEYTIDAEYKGTIIVLNTDLTVDTLTPTNSNKIIMEYTNANDTSENSKGTVETELNFVAPTGVVAANGIDNILSISDEKKVGEIPAYSESKVSTVYGKVVNNYENAISNVVVLGRLPVKDNKKIDSTESLGSTFNTTLKTNITVKGIQKENYIVYYSENVDATLDVSDAENGWSTEATTNAKSYMIVTNNFEMAAGNVIDFSYDVEIPEDLKYNNNVYEMYKVYYNNISSIGTMSESKTSSIIGLTTGQGVELKAELEATSEIVREGQVVKMKVTVKNTGSLVAENVKVNVPLPEKGTFMQYVIGEDIKEENEKEKIIEIGTIEAGETKQISYYIKFDEDMVGSFEFEDANRITIEEAEKREEQLKFPKEIATRVIITADDLSGSIKSNEYKFEVKEGKIALKMVCEKNEAIAIKKGDILTSEIDIKNISAMGDLDNTIVTIPLPKGTKYKSAIIKDSWEDESEITEGIVYDEKENTLKISIGTLEIEKIITFKLEVEEYEGSISMIAKVQADGTEEHFSNRIEFISEIIELEIHELTSTPKYVKEGNEVTYNLKILNKGKSTVYNIRLMDILPEELVFVKAIYVNNREKQEVTTLRNGRVEFDIGDILANESIDIQVIAKAKLLSNKEDKQIENKIKITANNYEGFTTNTVTNFIEYNEEIREQEEITDQIIPTEKKYKITGIAWIDEDKNGKREDEEAILSDITVMLLNKENNKIVKDPDTKNQKITTTDSQGKYEFTNVPKGEYIVIFLYDAAKYSLTTYRQKDVDTSLNSDVISVNITLDGKRTIAGTTDVIEIIDDNARNIDIGVYVSEKFDLKLDKFISKITLTTPTSGTKVHSEGNSKLEKVEVLEKNLGQSNVVIEYKIVVTNQGAVAGYAKKIVDYLPEGVGFNTELNKDWYLSKNGNVYNASLENELIQPGESKQIKLVVTKKITEESLGELINSAEIYESYNEEGLKDIDSTEGNKVKEEDDISEANVILSIVTGKIIMYATTIALGVVAILAFGIFEIKRNVLNKRK